MNNEINFLPLFQVEPLAGGGVHTDVDIPGPALQDQFVGGSTPHDQCILIQFFWQYGSVFQSNVTFGSENISDYKVGDKFFLKVYS